MGRKSDGLVGGGAIYGFYGAIKICLRDGYDPYGVFNLVLEEVMSINAIVEAVCHNENGSGKLSLTGDERGQPSLHFDSAPHDVTALNGRQIWGGANSILYGEVELAKRMGYTQIEFTVVSVGAAIKEADKKREKRAKTVSRHPSSVRDFAIEISTDSIGTTIQIFYNGHPSGGMSEFSGTPKRAIEGLAELLRKLATDVDVIQSHITG